MNDRVIDARGKACPQPVVETRRALLEDSPAVLRVIVDNPASAENVRRMAQSLGRTVETEREAPGEIHLVLTAGRGVAEAAAAGSRGANVVLLASAGWGEGDPELGAILMRAFVKTLKEVAPLPQAVLCVNGGVRLTTEGSPLLDALRELEDRGVRVLSCGTCLDFFHLKEALRVGAVTNMFEIATLLSGAPRVIRP